MLFTPQCFFVMSLHKVFAGFDRFPYFRFGHPVRALGERMSQNDKVPVAEKVNDPDLVSRQLNSEFVDAICKKIGIRPGKIRSVCFELRQPVKYFGLVINAPGIDEFINGAFTVSRFIIDDIPLLAH